MSKKEPVHRVYSWFDGNALVVERGIVKGRVQKKPGWKKRGGYPDRKFAQRHARQIEREEKTKTKIVVE